MSKISDSKQHCDVNFCETINIVRKYTILNAIDPYTRKVYDTNEISKLNLIDFKNGIYKIPSNGEFISLNLAIENGYLEVILVNESMESFCEYITYKTEIEIESENNSISSNSDENEVFFYFFCIICLTYFSCCKHFCFLTNCFIYKHVVEIVSHTLSLSLSLLPSFCCLLLK